MSILMILHQALYQHQCLSNTLCTKRRKGLDLTLPLLGEPFSTSLLFCTSHCFTDLTFISLSQRCIPSVLRMMTSPTGQEVKRRVQCLCETDRNPWAACLSSVPLKRRQIFMKYKNKDKWMGKSSKK